MNMPLTTDNRGQHMLEVRDEEVQALRAEVKRLRHDNEVLTRRLDEREFAINGDEDFLTHLPTPAQRWGIKQRRTQ